LWFYVPERGRFIFSLVPREGYSFEKIGILEGNKIEFVINGERYEWVSGVEILASGGVWNLWVLHDSRYTPLFGSDKPIRQDNKPPGILNKLGEMLDLQNGSLTLHKGNPPGPAKERALEVPKRVMVGSADNMDHLMPKSP